MKRLFCELLLDLVNNTSIFFKTISFCFGSYIFQWSLQYNCNVSWQSKCRLTKNTLKKNLSMFVSQLWLTVSVRAAPWGHLYLVKLKRIWIIDGENDTSFARGNERPTPGSFLSLLWVTESANKDDTWQPTRPIMSQDVHAYAEKHEEKKMTSGIT